MEDERARLGWNAFFQEQVERDSPPVRVVRIVEEQRGAYRVAGDFTGWAEISGKFRHDARSTADFPAVGDWVCITPPVGSSTEARPVHASAKPEGGSAKVERAVITRRLERRSTISRKAAGRAVEEQVLAANVDTIFLVTALAEDLNPRRLERYLAVVRDAGAVPVVVLNKTDLSADPDAQSADVRARLPFVDVLAISARNGEGLSALDSYLSPAQTVALIGSSGVGKSTIVNRLLGQERLKTAEISDVDGKGRHTTTARHLVELPGGALLIDTPGMRELQLYADEEALDTAFADVAELAAECRFSDCTHEHEPGCAVQAALEDGRLAPERWESYRKLQAEIRALEIRQDKRLQSEQRKRWRQFSRSMRKAQY